ncbi:MAG: PKD domain-containing protein [Bacteroidota bacterium]
MVRLTLHMISIRFILVWILPCIGIFGWSCKVQDLPEPQEDEVKYQISGQVMESDWKIEAGRAETYAFAEAELNSSNVYEFVGRIAPASCKDCGEWLEIRLRDIAFTPNPDTIVREESFYLGRRPFLQLDGGKVKRKAEVTLQPTEENEDWTYTWVFEDQSSSEAIVAKKLFDLDIQTETEVCLQTIDAEGCQTDICNRISLIDTTLNIDFDYRFLPNSNYLEFRSLITGQAPFDYQWDFGDGFTSKLANPGYAYAEALQYNVCLTATDFAGASQTLCKIVAADPSFCDHSFSYRVATVPVPDVLQFGAVELRYRSVEGTLYSSAWQPQDGNAYFDLLSTQSGPETREGGKAQIIEFLGNAQLWSESGESISLQSFQGRFLMGIPK